MGRCYEFGVSIHDGCEHAMVVAAEGGHCECQVCATSCPGRFSGCAQVVARPGYVPLLAPRLPLPSAPPPASTVPVAVAPRPVEANGSAEATPSPPAPSGAVSLVQDLLEELRRQRATNDEMRSTMAELGERLGSLERALARLSETSLWELLRR